MDVGGADYTELARDDYAELTAPPDHWRPEKWRQQMPTVLEQAMGLSADEKLQLISALWDSMATNRDKERVEQMLLEAVDQIDRGECAPWQPGEGRRILDDVIRRHKESGNK